MRNYLGSVFTALLLLGLQTNLGFTADGAAEESTWQKFKRGTKMAGEAIATGTKNTAEKVADGSKKAARAVADGYDDAKEYVKEKIEPDSAVGVRDVDGNMNYGSPTIEHKQANAQQFLIEYFSHDPEYGYTVEKPVMVGNGGNIVNGPLYEARYLNALAGPGLQPIAFKRQGSAHPFKTANSPFGDEGLLDVYEISYEGLAEPVTLYLNMYDSDTLKVPVGFTLAPPPAQ